MESLCDLFTDGDWIEAKDQSNLGVRLVQTGKVGITQYLDKENNKKWISEEKFEKLHCKKYFKVIFLFQDYLSQREGLVLCLI